MEFTDSLAPGLVLRVARGGAKSWSLKYKVPGEGGVTSTGRMKKGRSHRLTLGYMAGHVAGGRTRRCCDRRAAGGNRG